MNSPKTASLTRGYLMTICGGLCWSIGGSCGQVLFRDCGVTSNWLVPIRMLIGGLITLTLSAILGEQPLRLLKHREIHKTLLVFSLIGSALCQYSFYSSVQYANIAFATVISYCSPVLILLWDVLRNHKRPLLYEAVCVLLVVVGAFVCVTHGNIHTLAVPAKGAIWGIISSVCFSFYTLSPRKLMQSFPVLSVTGWGMTIGGIAMLILFRPWSIQGVQYSGKLFLLLACVILIGTVLSFGLFQSGCNIVGGFAGSVLSSVEPIGAVIISVLFLNTTFSWLDLLGFALILSTIPLMAFGRSKNASIASV